MSVVVFNQAKFLESYPEFSATVAATPTAAKVCFENACLYLDNTDASRVPDPPRGALLMMLTAHLLVLRFGVNGRPASGLVGRITSAGEGSVNVSVDSMSQSNSAKWYQQTQYGASYWKASAPYRTAVYVPPACAVPTYTRW